MDNTLYWHSSKIDTALFKVSSSFLVNKSCYLFCKSEIVILNIVYVRCLSITIYNYNSNNKY